MVSYIFNVGEQLQNALNSSCKVVLNTKLSLNGAFQKKINIPIILVHSSAVIVFSELNSCCDEDRKEVVSTFRRVLNYLVERTELSVNSFMLCGYSDGSAETNVSKKLCTFNIYNDRVNFYSYDSEVDNFINVLVDETTYRQYSFDENQIENIAFSLELVGGVNGQVRKDSSGKYYIKKHGQWLLASELNADEIFNGASLFGAFGVHKFLEHKKASGVAYLLSCGLFGVGWLFDCLMLFFGIYRDKDNKYLLPLSNRRAALSKFVGGLFITVIYMSIYLFIARFFSDFLNNILLSSIEQ